MIQGKTVTAIIPARGQSKGLPGKNIRPLGGKPLIHWTIDAAQQSEYIDRTILSSEDPEIIATAKNAGCEVPFVRPLELARDDSSSLEVVLHALEILPTFDILVLLQATSPFRTRQHIDEALRLFINSDADSCVSVCRPHISPYWMYTMNQDHFLQNIIEPSNAQQRQALPDVYALNGAIYIIGRDTLVQTKRFVGNRTIPYPMDSVSSIDIDYALDFQLAQTVIDQR